MIDLRLGDCIEVLKTLEDNSVDSIVTDPPYGLSFMNKKWDYDVPSVDVWKECLRVLKPGGHLLSFGGSRTYHRMALAIEDAGFEVRDQIMWVYGSGFPKSHNIGKAIDKIQGNEREVLGTKAEFSLDGAKRNPNNHREVGEAAKEIQHEYGYKQGWDAPVTKGQSDWEGWGTALKPAHEPICMARKPLSEKSIAENVLKHGTGGINIDGSRIGTDEKTQRANKGVEWGFRKDSYYENREEELFGSTLGRFPANVILDEEAGKLLDEQSGIKKSQKRSSKHNKDTEHTNTYTPAKSDYRDDNTYADKGGASRFFYCPKVSKKERNAGLEDMEDRPSQLNSGGIGRKTSVEKRLETNGENAPTTKNHHPTVKPIALMEYLIKLVTPKGGTVLEPFMGSGSTGIAAKNLGMSFIGIEKEEEYMEIAKRRIENYETIR